MSKMKKAAEAAEFEFHITTIDKGIRTMVGPVVDVQVDCHHPTIGSAAVLHGMDLRPEVAEALALAFTRPFTSSSRIDYIDKTNQPKGKSDARATAEAG